MKKKLMMVVKSTLLWGIACTIRFWSQFLYTLLSSKDGVQTVYVTGGIIDADISNRIQVEGTISVANEVDVNVSAINGYSNCFYNNYTKHSNDYYRIPVIDYYYHYHKVPI